MDPLPDTQHFGLCKRREGRERIPRRRLQMNPPVSDPCMHHGTCVTYVPRCIQGSLTCDGGENVSGIPAACATHNFAYLARGQWTVNCGTLQTAPLSLIVKCMAPYKNQRRWCFADGCLFAYIHINCANYIKRNSVWISGKVSTVCYTSNVKVS